MPYPGSHGKAFQWPYKMKERGKGRPDVDRPKLPKSWIVGLFGSKGQGKSLYMAVLGESEHRRNPGRPVLYYPESYQHISGEPITLPELLTGSDRLNGAIIMIDEMQVVLNKYRSASRANREIMGFIQQIRKRGCTLFYTTNSRKQLDRAIGEQTDAHAYLELHVDRKCERESPNHHLKDCRDYIVQNWVDTQGTKGYDGRYRDGRKRWRKLLPRVTRYHHLYNTLATASVAEFQNITPEAIAAAHDEAMTQLSIPELVDAMKGWIPGMVQTNGAKRLVPGTFARFVAQQTEGKMQPTPEMIGRAAGILGLYRKRTKAGVAYELPAREDVLNGLWQAGLA